LLRIVAGVAAALLLATGVFFIWQSRAEQGPDLPPAPAARTYNASMLGQSPLQAPEASPGNREEKRFSRADKNKDGKIEAEELLGARRKAFAKLDANGNGALSFDEWAAKTIGKFQGADANHDGVLTAMEYATTAPPPPKHKMCSCNAPASYASNDD
jgi:hypothetical protein